MSEPRAGPGQNRIDRLQYVGGGIGLGDTPASPAVRRQALLVTAGHDDHRHGPRGQFVDQGIAHLPPRSEEHTSELQSLMRISYAVFCLKKKKKTTHIKTTRLKSNS